MSEMYLSLFLSFIALGFVAGFETLTEEKQFIDSLLEKTTKYTPHSKMVNNTVFLYTDLYQLIDVDEKGGFVNAKIWLYLTYYLDHLAWDPAENNIYSVQLPANSVWTPDILFYEAAKVDYDLYLDQQIQYFGMVIAKSTIINVKLTCTFNVQLFPFDTQECVFQAGHWCSTKSLYRLSIDLPYQSQTNELDLQYFEQSGQWFLIRPVYLKFGGRTFKNLTYWQYDTIEYTFKFKRHPTFYVNVLLLPSILMAILSILCFLLPVESGEKVSLGITILLSQAVQLLVLSDILPPTSQDFPIMAQFIVFTIVLISISVVTSVVVVRVYLTPECSPPPPVVFKIVNCFLMKLLLISTLDEKLTGHPLENKKSKGSNQISPYVKDDNMEMISKEQPSENGKVGPDVDISSDIDPKLKGTICWRVFSDLIDRAVLILYVTALAGGSLYYSVILVKSD